MHKAKFAGFVGTLIVAILATGCGGGDAGGGSGPASTSTSSLTKAEFIKQGDAICKKHGEQDNAKFQAYAKENKIPAGGEPSKAQQEELIEEIILPSIRGQAEEIGDLSAPSGDEGKVSAIVEGLEEAVKEATKNPVLVLEGGGTFAGIKKLASEYGFKVCG